MYALGETTVVLVGIELERRTSVTSVLVLIIWLFTGILGDASSNPGSDEYHPIGGSADGRQEAALSTSLPGCGKRTGKWCNLLEKGCSRSFSFI